MENFSATIALRYGIGVVVTFVMTVICMIVSDHFKDKRRYGLAEFFSYVSYALDLVIVGLFILIVQGTIMYAASFFK